MDRVKTGVVEMEKLEVRIGNEKESRHAGKSSARRVATGATWSCDGQPYYGHSKRVLDLNPGVFLAVFAWHLKFFYPDPTVQLVQLGLV